MEVTCYITKHSNSMSWVDERRRLGRLSERLKNEQKSIVTNMAEQRKKTGAVKGCGQKRWQNHEDGTKQKKRSRENRRRNFVEVTNLRIYSIWKKCTVKGFFRNYQNLYPTTVAVFVIILLKEVTDEIKQNLLKWCSDRRLLKSYTAPLHFPSLFTAFIRIYLFLDFRSLKIARGFITLECFYTFP